MSKYGLYTKIACKILYSRKQFMRAFGLTTNSTSLIMLATQQPNQAFKETT